MSKRKAIIWVASFALLVIALLTTIAYWMIRIDPFFHYHKPRTNEYFYTLDNERSQNDGIIKHFDYQGLITGTSMTQNFKTSDAELLWKGLKFIKVPFSGASYKEINDNIATAIKYNPKLEVIIRGLDLGMFFNDKNSMRFDLGEYPTYLYDNDVFNDVQYVFNRDVIFSRAIPMTEANDEPHFRGGITSFDQYSNWMNKKTFGRNTLYPNGVSSIKLCEPVHLSDQERETIIENIHQNVTSLADENPQIKFLYFFTPYSIQWWGSLADGSNGNIYKHIEAEKVIIEEIIQHKNIKLFSFNNQAKITTDLNNYKDWSHYGEWINSLILHFIYENRCLISIDNYKEYLEDELLLYTTFDYEKLNEQTDYDDDYDAMIKVAEEEFGIVGKELQLDSELNQLSNATIIEDQYDGKPGVLCQGCLGRGSTEGTDSEYIRDVDFVGLKTRIEDIGSNRFIVLRGKKLKDAGMPRVFIYDNTGRVVAQCGESYRNLDTEWHKYYLDVTGLTGEVTIVFNGGYIDMSGPDSQYVFSDIVLY